MEMTNEQTLERIAAALEALAAAEIHRLWNDRTELMARTKNTGFTADFIRRHPCPLCNKSEDSENVNS